MSNFKVQFLSSKLVRRVGYYMVPTIGHWCPACKEIHDFAVEGAFTNGAKWTWSGNTATPTFTPSMNIKIGPYPSEPGEPPGQIEVCHYFLTNGVISYLPDCTHDMKGQQVALPDIPKEATQYADIVS